MEQWTLYGIIVLTVTILAAIAAILSVKQPSVRVLLLSILGFVGLLAIGAIVVSIQSAAIKPPPSPTPTPTPTATPTPTLTPTATPTPTLTPGPSPLPTPSPSLTDETPVAGTSTGSRIGKPSPPQPAESVNSPAYEPGDIGITKDNGSYEIMVENATLSYSSRMCPRGWVNVSDDQKMVAVRFSIRALTLEVPSIPTGEDFTSYYLVEPQGRRFEMRCGDGRYFNVSLNSQAGKPKAKVLTVEFLVPKNQHRLSFRFHPPVGNAIVVSLPNSI